MSEYLFNNVAGLRFSPVNIANFLGTPIENGLQM